MTDSEEKRDPPELASYRSRVREAAERVWKCWEELAIVDTAMESLDRYLKMLLWDLPAGEERELAERLKQATQMALRMSRRGGITVEVFEQVEPLMEQLLALPTYHILPGFRAASERIPRGTE